jgi:hypothetical protein
VKDLFSRFSDIIRSLSPNELDHPQRVERLTLDCEHIGDRTVKLIYAPFDYVNLEAKVVIVGITPGRQQASNALKAAKRGLDRGLNAEAASADAKVFASFSGPMRTNLVAMMDSVGIARRLGIQSCISLWGQHSELVHFTSAIRYPVFVDGKDWSGSNPTALRLPSMRRWLADYTGEELRLLSRALIIPLGPKVTDMLQILAAGGLIQPDRIIAGLPHPSGANAERIAYFLGRKPKDKLSPKTNAEALDTARESVLTRVSAIS